MRVQRHTCVCCGGGWLQVSRDICSILQIQPEQFTASVNRPSLCYEVLHKAASAEAASAQVVAWVQQQARGTSGIVYCLTRCGTLAACSCLRTAQLLVRSVAGSGSC